MPYNFYQVGDGVFEITTDRYNTPSDSEPGIPPPATPGGPLARSQSVKIDPQTGRAIQDYIDVEFQDVTPRQAGGQPATAIEPIQRNGDKLSNNGRKWRRGIRLPEGALSVGMELAYQALELSQVFLPPPCPELTDEEFYTNLYTNEQDIQTAITTAETIDDVNNLTTGLCAIAGAGALAATLTGVGAPLGIPIGAISAYTCGTALGVSTINVVSDHVLRNNAIHQARLNAAVEFEPQEDEDPCATGSPPMVRRLQQPTDCPPCDCVATVPEYWEIRVGANRPEVVYAIRDVRPDGSYGQKWREICIPHYRPTEQTVERLPDYEKGSTGGVLILNDNSKAVFYCKNREEAQRMVDWARTVIEAIYLVGSDEQVGFTRDSATDTGLFRAARADFYPTGQRNLSPVWRKRWAS